MGVDMAGWPVDSSPQKNHLEAQPHTSPPEALVQGLFYGINKELRVFVRVHAMWTLEGLGKLSPDIIKENIKDINIHRIPFGFTLLTFAISSGELLMPIFMIIGSNIFTTPNC